MRLKELRKFHKKTQQDVADILGITRGAYSNIENAKREPDINTLNILAEYYDVSIDYLLGRTNTPDMADKIADRLGILEKERTPEEEGVYMALQNDDKFREIFMRIYALPESAREGFLQFADAVIARNRKDDDKK